MFDGLPLLATIFGFIALFGGAAGYFKASRGDSIIKYQTIEIDNLRTKIADYEKEVAKLTTENAAKDTAITQLKEHVGYLQKLGQGSPQLKKLTVAIANQTKLINQLIENLMKKEGAK